MTEEVGAHCQYDICNQLDILPFKCHYCKGFFCLEHFRPEEHKCKLAGREDRRVFTCPLCLKTLPLRCDEPADVTWEEHNRKDCHHNTKNVQRCPAKGCKMRITDINAFTCKQCNQTVCMKHRFGSDHDCNPHNPHNPHKPTHEKRGFWKRLFTRRIKTKH